MTRFLSLHRFGLLAFLFVGIASALYAQTITTFDAPSSIHTYPTAINSAGQITGLAGSNGAGAFLRESDGTFIIFNYEYGGNTWFTQVVFPSISQISDPEDQMRS